MKKTKNPPTRVLKRKMMLTRYSSHATTAALDDGGGWIRPKRVNCALSSSIVAPAPATAITPPAPDDDEDGDADADASAKTLSVATSQRASSDGGSRLKRCATTAGPVPAAKTSPGRRSSA